MTSSKVGRKWRDPLWLFTGVVLYAFGSTAILAGFWMVQTSISERFSIHLSLWLAPVVSGLLIVGLYPIFGRPVADHYFRRDTFLRKLERQLLWSLLFLPVLLVAVEITMVLVVSVVVRPYDAVNVASVFSIYVVLLNSLFGIVVGIPCALGLAWISESVRELPYYSH